MTGGFQRTFGWLDLYKNRIIVVFGITPAAAEAAVRHVRSGTFGIPVWLFCRSEPSASTVEMCGRVFVHPSALVIVRAALSLLWRRRVALAVGTWTGEPGDWLVKLVPFLIPPFRPLFLNAHGDFMNGRSAAALLYAWRCGKGGVADCVSRLRALRHEVSAAIHRAFRRTLGKLRSAAYRAGDEGRAVSVRYAASFFQIAGHPQRKWFSQLHGKSELCVNPAGENSGGVALFHSPGRDWHGDAIEAQVSSSDARWLVWREAGTDYDTGHLLTLFEDNRTFAVSIQSHVRGWSPSLIFMAPFRALQPGEATPLLAPLSHTMVVDRRKLAALGIPRCGLSTTAWMEIFWRAAAAGWRSYCVGQSAPLGQQPDYPAPEAEFFFRSLIRPNLLRLGPQAPNLMRGNLAFRLPGESSSRQQSGRLRVLIVSPFLPFPLTHGGAVRIWNLCRALRDRVDFYLVAVRERDEYVDYDRLGEVFVETHVIDPDELPSKDTALPDQVRHHQSQSLAALIRDLSVRVRPDLIQIEYTHLAHFVEVQSAIPCILVEHDITFSLYAQLAESNSSRKAQLEYQRWLAYERRYLREFDAVWTMSEDDRSLAVREGSDPDSTSIIPNGVDVTRFTPRHETEEEPEILYVGSFRHLPNILGFEMLCHDVMPEVWRRHPQVRLRVVAGPRHEMFWNRFRAGIPLLTDTRIDVHGFVADLRPQYAAASVVAVPLAVSAGTNIKVLEAMACGKAIVSTPVGCAGLGLHDGEELFIREPEDFACAISALLESLDLRANLGTCARHTAEQRFSWKAIAGRAYRSYLDLAWVGLKSKAS